MSDQAITTHDAVQMQLRSRWKALQSMVPDTVTPERLARVALSSINRVPKLNRCSPESIVEGIMQGAALGLEVNDGTGRAYLIPRGGQATFQLGYPGLVELAYRSGQVSSIETRAVHEGDDFTYELGLTPQLHHIPIDDGDERMLSHTYVVIRLRDGGTLFDVMSRREIEKIRRRSAAGGGPWKTDYDEMAKKTVLRRGLKLVPKAIELHTAINRELELESVTVSPKPSAFERLAVEQVEEPEGE